MSAELLKLCDPQEYYEPYLLQGVYPDGRSLSDFRGTSVQVGYNVSARGSALVKQAGSMVDVSVYLELAVKGEEPQLLFSVEGPESADETALDDAHMILGQMSENKTLVDMESIACNDERLMWVVKVNVEILSIDTSYIDAMVAAVTAAFLDTKVPEVRFAEAIDEDAPVDLTKAIITDKCSPFKLVDVPISSSFAIYKTRTCKESKCILLVDPIDELSKVIVSKCIFVVGEGETVHSMLMSGGEAVDLETIKKFHAFAKRRHESLTAALRNITGRLVN
uniref:Ribosomal RNA-processing protein 43 n=1 Tax=Steinernema glaseri TaxID=37863 RepID=A0A1I7ZGI5_9BILA